MFYEPTFGRKYVSIMSLSHKKPSNAKMNVSRLKQILYSEFIMFRIHVIAYIFTSLCFVVTCGEFTPIINCKKHIYKILKNIEDFDVEIKY